MKTTLLALVLGGLIEGLFSATIIGTSWGPCGPSSGLAYVGVLGHLFPGLLVGYVAGSLHAPEWLAWALVVVSQWACWPFLIRACLPASDE